MLNLLIVDDEEDVLELYKIIIEGKFSCNYFTAKNGEEAVEVLKKHPEIDYIIADYSMPGSNGSVVYNFNKENPKTDGSIRPFLFVTGKSIGELKELNDFNPASSHDFFLNKPIKELTFITTIKKMLSGPENTAEMEENMAVEIGDYKSISIDALKNIDLVDAELFVKIGEEKFVKVKNESDIVTTNDLLKYRKNSGDKLFVKKSYFEELTTNALKTINQKISKAETEGEVKKVTADLLNHIYQGFDQFGITSEQIVLVNESVDKCQKVLAEKKGFKSLMAKFQRDQGYLVSHSMMAMHIATMISNNMGMSDQRHLEKLSYASLLHDISLTDPSLSEVFSKNTDEFKKLSKQNRDAILAHPQQIADFVEDKPELPQDVYYIVLEHHERPDGSGFPKGINSNRITQISALFIISLRVADHLYHHQFKNLKELVIDLKENYMTGSFKKPCEAFFKTFKQAD